MVDRVHHNASDMRPFPLPPSPPRFPYGDILVIKVPDLPDRRHARTQNSTHFTRLQPDLDVITIAPHYLREPPGAPNQLATFTGFQLDIMNSRSQGHAAQCERIPQPNFGLWTRLNFVVHIQSEWSQNVPLLPIPVLE
jgi:hypothetical protein